MESASAMGHSPRAAAPEYAPSLAPVPASAAVTPAPATEPDPHAEFLAKDPDAQREILVRLLRAGESDAAIGARFRLSQWQVRNLRYRLGIRKDRGGNVHLAPRAPRPGGEAAAPVNVALQVTGAFEAGDLARRLLALGALFEAAPATYRVQLQIEQVTRGA
jgi:hypothetical protein